MTFEAIKEAVLQLNAADQKRLILELVPQIWPRACQDDACLVQMRELVDEEAVKKFRAQHFNSV
ncbi:MAG: hypothetical protein AUK55_15455 [Syntrophobacteraceae bacterium CG2_30_61_12]|nr:MAG: hypothetical protein AUK55_15455 [Syntrophobacteraceae bacterium CG2_30_61_12]